MKIAVLHGPRVLRIEEQDLDTTLAPDQVHVKTQISAFKIGTDRGNYGCSRVFTQPIDVRVASLCGLGTRSTSGPSGLTGRGRAG